MSDPIPSLTPTERAMLEQFRVDQSPHPAVSGRVLHALQLQIGVAPSALQSQWWLWLRAGGLSFAIAAGTLVVLGGTARVLGRATAPAPMAAADARASNAPQRSANVPEPDAGAAVVAPALPVTPPPVSPAAPAEAAAPDPVEAVLDRGGRPRSDESAASGRGNASRPANPVDAAAEIAAFRSIKLEPGAQARLAAITRYRDEFAAGTFVQEVAVLELQTLCALGRTEDAARRGAAFVQSFNDSAYAEIARRGCTEAPK